MKRRHWWPAAALMAMALIVLMGVSRSDRRTGLQLGPAELASAWHSVGTAGEYILSPLLTFERIVLAPRTDTSRVSVERKASSNVAAPYSQSSDRVLDSSIHRDGLSTPQRESDARGAATASGLISTELIVPDGTVLLVRLDSRIESKGRTPVAVRGTVWREVRVGEALAIPKGSGLIGHISAVRNSDGGSGMRKLAFWRRRPAPAVFFRFDSLKLPDDARGDPYAIRTTGAGRHGRAPTLMMAIPIAAATAGGAIVAGGAGAVAGAAAGTALVGGLSSGVRLDRGTIVSVQLLGPLSIRRPLGR